MFAVVNPYFRNIFWQIPDGLEILSGHFPSSVSYALASGPLISQEWLYEAALAWAVSHNAFGAFALFCGLAAAATPLLTYAAIRAFGIGDVAAGVAAFLVLGARFVGLGVRPETFAIDAFAIELIVLAGARKTLWTLPTTLLWANVHASVIIAPVVALAYALVSGVAARGVDERVRRGIAVAAVTFAATFVTPYGIRLWSYAIALTVGANPVRQHLDAWKPLAFDGFGSVAAVLPGILIFMCFGTVAKRRDAGELAIAAMFFALTLLHTRYATFLVVAWAPALARTLEERTRLGTFSMRLPGAAVFGLAPLLLYALLHGLTVFRAPADVAGPWRAATRIVAARGLHGNAYAPYLWAAYLHWRGLPVRLLIDGHGDAYPPDVWNDHLALQDLRGNWRDVLQRRRIDVVVVPLDTPLAQALLLEPAWREVEVRDGIVAFVRR